MKRDKKNMEDLISELPDEILVCIVSFLTIKEAMRSSILSSRWKCLWTFFIGNLEFEPSESVKKAVEENFSFGALDSAGHGLVTLVNQVLESHKGPTVDKFKVCYDMGADYSSDINRWINFAIERRVRALELDFQPHFENVHGKRYTFPSQFLKSLSFGSVRDLRLKFLNVTGEVVVYFLSNCPFLEAFCVEHSKCLVKLKISSPSLKLLVIGSCNELQNLEISASNLQSFAYGGPTISRPFKNVPCLVKLCLGGNYCASITSKFRHISRVLSRVKGLVLLLDDEVHFSFRCPKSFKLSNLMYLELQLNIIADDGKCLLSCMSLIKAAPLLHTFALKPSSHYYLQGEVKISDSMKFPHQCLKEVEVVGLVWYRPVVELTKCLIKKCCVT